MATLRFIFAQYRRAESIQRAARRCRKAQSLGELATLLYKYSIWYGADSPEVRCICRHIREFRLR